MRRLIQFVARLYPASWRARYGIEFDALLESVDLGWRDMLDVLKRAATMQAKRVAVIAVGLALLGGLVAELVLRWLPETYVSSGFVHVEQTWGESEAGQPGGDEGSLQSGLVRFLDEALTDDSLAAIIRKEGLYGYEGEQDFESLDQLTKRMRSATTIQVAPVATAPRWANTSFQVAFVDQDGARAQRVVADLIAVILEANLADAQLHKARFQQFRMLDPPILPTKPIGRNRLLVIAFGCSIGLSLGLIAVYLRRGPSPRLA